MLRLVDTMLAQASGNKAFDVLIPLLDTSISKVISFGSVFTDALFEYFVIAQRFSDRKVKSLAIKGYVSKVCLHGFVIQTRDQSNNN